MSSVLHNCYPVFPPLWKQCSKKTRVPWDARVLLPSQLPPWFIMKTAWHFQVDFTTQLFINAKLIYMMLALWNPDDMCYEAQEPVFIYTAKMLDSSTGLSVGALLKSKRSDLIIRHYLVLKPHTYLVNFGGQMSWQGSNRKVMRWQPEILQRL